MKDLVSYLLYPKVFEDYYNHKLKFGDVRIIPTKVFYYGMEPGEEIVIVGKDGKQFLIRLFGIGETEPDGNVPMLFEVNGHPRPVRIKDLSVETDELLREKADPDIKGEVGSPLAGKIMKLFVDENDTVEIDQTLFVIEAMKMQTNIKSNMKGLVQRIPITEGENVEAGDLIIKIEENS